MKGNKLIEILANEHFDAIRLKQSKSPFSSKNNKYFKEGKYYCATCGNQLFVSVDQYDSYSGWPSSIKPANEESISTKLELDLNMIRTEVICFKCKSHLGHVFEDGPSPAGLRYCIDSVALKFQKD